MCYEKCSSNDFMGNTNTSALFLISVILSLRRDGSLEACLETFNEVLGSLCRLSMAVTGTLFGKADTAGAPLEQGLGAGGVVVGGLDEEAGADVDEVWPPGVVPEDGGATAGAEVALDAGAGGVDGKGGGGRGDALGVGKVERP